MRHEGSDPTARALAIHGAHRLQEIPKASA